MRLEIVSDPAPRGIAAIYSCGVICVSVGGSDETGYASAQCSELGYPEKKASLRLVSEDQDRELGTSLALCRLG